MISFRYHIVSIVAVFLALALGIVVGTTALNGPITKDLRSQVNDLKKQRDGLGAQVKTLQGRVDDAGQFATTYGPQLLHGTLTGKSVLVVNMPGSSSDMADGLVEEFTAAGAKTAGRLTLTTDYVDPRLANQISAVATDPSLHPVGLTYPETSDAGQLAAALLSYVLLGQGKATDLTAVLSAFSNLHVLDGDNIAPATEVVVVSNGTLQPNSYAGEAELALVAAFAKRGGHVLVAGDNESATDAGLVALVRKGTAAKGAVATVDDADNAFGQVTAVLALTAALKGNVGHYGTAQNADALFPSPPK